MNWFSIVFNFGCVIASVLTDTRTINLTDQQTSVEWSTSTEETINVEAEAGYQITVDVLNINLNGEDDDYVIVQNIPDDGEESEGMMFTYTISAQPSYFYNTNKVQASYVGKSSTDAFSIRFTRVGEALTTTTTKSTTTTEALPTPEHEDKSVITVYLYGLAASAYDETTVGKLKVMLAEMGKHYCSVQVCPINGTITTNNVNIKLLQKCSILWENHDTCVTLTFGLPINILEDYDDDPLWSGYQLNQNHLQIMWDTYASDRVPDIGLSLYPVPNVNAISKHKIILFSFILIMFIILVLILRHVAEKIRKRRKRRASDTISIVNTSNRNSQMSLTPHYLQELPPLFSNDFPIYTEQKTHLGNYDFNQDYTEEADIKKQGETLTIVADFHDMEEVDA